MSAQIEWRQGEPYRTISEAISDAMEGKGCFVGGIQVDCRYVLTSTVEHLQQLIVRGRIRRAAEEAP